MSGAASYDALLRDAAVALTAAGIDNARFEARLLDFDAKRIHFYQEMFHGTEGYLAASQESLSSHVSMATRRTAPFPEELLGRLAAIKEAHAVLPRPWQVGHVIRAAGLGIR